MAIRLREASILFAVMACDRSKTAPAPHDEPAAVVARTVAIDPPAARGAASPNLVATSDGALLTWLEPVDAARSAHRLRFARLGGGTWSKPTTITEGPAIIANWADVPSVARQDNGTLVAHWAEKSALPDPHGYDVVLARSTDGGATWRRLGLAHHDGTDTEHGFVSLLPDGDAMLAIWLDGRATAEGPTGATALRSARIGEAIGDERVIDDRVCDCCSTSAVATADGPVVAYRDRTADELRDPWVVRRIADTWSDPHPVDADGWRITACPVNGPTIAAAGRELAVAWYTAAEQPRVRIAFSSNAGATFDPPIDVDAPRGTRAPMGRVDAVLVRPGEALVSWMASEQDGVRVLVRRVARDRRRGPELQIASLAAAPDAGVPRMESAGSEVLLAWTDTRSKTVRVARLAIADVPAVSVSDAAR